MSMHEIVPYIYLGDHSYLGSHIHRYGIKHIINVCQEPTRYFSDSIKSFTHVVIRDQEDENILIHLPRLLAIIEDAVAKKEPVLVHCAAGISRSATVVIAYIMKVTHITVDEAEDLVRSKRRQIGPNLGFMRQLKEFEKVLHQDGCLFCNTKPPCPSHPKARGCTWFAGCLNSFFNWLCPKNE